MYDPRIISFNKPDTLIPDPNNPLDFNRYGYARYNPLKYTDPTGHAVDAGCQTVGCGVNGPAKLARLYSTTDALDPVNPWSAEHHQRDANLSQAIDTYMKSHPNYNPLEDPGFRDENGQLLPEYDVFRKVRETYWLELAGGDPMLARQLQSYYDFGHRGPGVEQLNFDWSRMSSEDKAGLTLDVVSFGASFVGLNPFVKAFSDPAVDLLTDIGFLAELGTTADAYYSSDKDSQALTFLGWSPGPLGIIASGLGVLYDLSKPFYFTPPIAR